MAIKVINRSMNIVGYELPEINTKRTFNYNEEKLIEPAELEMLSQADGGMELIKHYLLVDSREWVERHFEAPIEYWWKTEDVKECLLEDELDLFIETLDYAPLGVIEILKDLSWKIPIRDLNKINAIKEKTGFDVLGAIEIMKDDGPTEPVKKPARRRRQEN